MYHLADGNCEYEEKEMYASITKVEPIPLTPEILEKAGFKKRPNGVYQKGSFVLQEAVGFGYWVIAQVDQVDGTVHLLQNELRYVHKMQNIFYDLGEELKIEL